MCGDFYPGSPALVNISLIKRMDSGARVPGSKPSITPYYCVIWTSYFTVCFFHLQNGDNMNYFIGRVTSRIK